MMKLFGHLHILIVHFPIAFIVGATAIMLARSFCARMNPESTIYRVLVLPDGAARGLLLFGAAGAVLAALTGLVFAWTDPPRPSVAGLLAWHRWLGLATAAMACASVWAVNRNLRLARVAVLATVILAAVTAHIGGSMTWGPKFLVGQHPINDVDAPRLAEDTYPGHVELGIVRPILAVEDGKQ